MARDHLLAPALPGGLPVGRGAGRSHRARSRVLGGYARRHRLHEGEAEGAGLEAARARQQRRDQPKKPGGARLNTIETSEHDWKTVFQVNFFGPIMLARGLMDELVAAKGAVVNVTSIAGQRVHPFAGAAYSTSKAALAALTREMAADFGPHGVRVNAISPGEIETRFSRPERRSWWRRSRSGVWGNRKKSPSPSIFCVRTVRAT